MARVNDLLTIIVTVHNTAQYLGKCLDSIRAQRYHNIQVVLIDDDSTDGSARICDVYASLDPRFAVVHKNPSAGCAAARQTGMLCAEGEYVYFSDDDDWLDPALSSDMMLVLGQTGADAVLFGAYDHTPGTPQGRYCRPCSISPGYYDSNALKRNVFPRMLNGGIEPMLWQKIMRRRVMYDAIMRVDPLIKKATDEAAAYEALYACRSIAVVDKGYYHRQQRSGSMTQRVHPDLYTSVERLLNHMLSGPLGAAPVMRRQIKQKIKGTMSYGESVHEKMQYKFSNEQLAVRARILSRIRNL